MAVTAAPRFENLGAVLRAVHARAPVRRRELTAQLGLSRSAIGSLLEELQALGLVAVQTRPPPAGSTGRPSHLVVADPDGPVVVAAHIGSRSYSVGLVALGGTVVHAATRPLPRPSTPDRVLSSVAADAARTIRAGRRPCLGLGVAVPSAVSRADQHALAALYLRWPAAVPVRAMLADVLVAEGVRAAGGGELPVHAGNDANLAALAEHRHGAGTGASEMLFVTTGQQGIGGALVTDGRLFTGSAGYAMEVGHITVEPRGRRCHCGNRGCLDVEADARALVRGRPRDVEAAARRVVAAAATDAAARASVRRVADRLAVGLAALVNIVNPDRIVLGGLCADVDAALPDRIASTVRHRSFLDAASEVPIVRAQLGDDAILLGAGEAALQPLLDHPRRVVGEPTTPAPPPDGLGQGGHRPHSRSSTRPARASSASIASRTRSSR